MSGKPLDKYTDTTTPVSTSVQGCGNVEVKHETYYPDDLGQRLPAANVPFKLQIPHGGNIFGTTDANGVLRFEGTGEGTFHCEYEPTLHIEKDQILNEIRTALDELIKVERDETAKIIKQLDEQPWYADAADYGMAAVRGVWNGIVGIVEFVGTVLWGAAKGLYHASKYLNPLTAPETFKQDMAALKETYQELKEFKDEDLETYLMLANDEETWQVFSKFAEDYVDAQHSLEWTEGGGETVFAIILIVVTAGAGAAGAAGSAGSRLAQLGQKLSGPIKRLTDVLKRARAKKKVKDKTNQRVESEAEIKDNKLPYNTEKNRQESSGGGQNDKPKKNQASSNFAGATFEGGLYRSVPEGRNPLEIHPIFNTEKAVHRYTGEGQGGLYLGSSQRIVNSEFTGNGASIDGLVNNKYDVKIDGLLDLTNPSVRKDLGVSLDDLVRTGGTKEWRYEVTNPLGRYAEDRGYNGIIAPAAQADGGANVILFNPSLVK